MTVKGWRIDLYRKKPRAGEAMLPVAEQTWPLRSIEWVVDVDNGVPTNAALPALDTIPSSSLTVAFSARGSSNSSSTAGSSFSSSAEISSTLTLRTISQFDHGAVSTLLLRAWYRSSTTSPMIDCWRKKAVFRAMIAGRGGTVAPGRAGRGRMEGETPSHACGCDLLGGRKNGKMRINGQASQRGRACASTRTRISSYSREEIP